MKKLLLPLVFAATLTSCNNNNPAATKEEANKELASMLDKYYEERLQLFPLEATQNGDNRYNDKLYADFTDTYRSKLKDFYNKYAKEIDAFKRNELNDNDKISYDVFKREMAMSLRGLTFQDNLTPLNQFWGKHLDLGQLGSGDGNQPFKTFEDYTNWINRAAAFSVWTDSAIVYFKKGIAANYVLPKSLVVKIIPQCKSIVVDDVPKACFGDLLKKCQQGFLIRIKSN